MNPKLKKALKSGFEPPVPQKKDFFLAQVETPPISFLQFLTLQLGYIRKWIWIFFIFSFLLMLIGTAYLKKYILWDISAFTPLLALFLITETQRSEFYGMSEFELSTRFSLKSIVLARLGIMGLSTFLFICLLTPFLIMNSSFTFLQMGIYLLCPYLLTVFCSLWTVRKIHGKESIYWCTAITFFISASDLFFHQSYPFLYEKQNFIWWIVTFLFLGTGTAIQCYQKIQQTEELTWNL